MDVLGSLFWRSYQCVRPWRERRALSFIKSYDPRIPTPKLPLKCAYILRLLEKHRPKFIVELGSGQSTIWFASYAGKYGARVLTIDENAEYQRQWTYEANKLHPIESIASEVTYLEDGSARYKTQIPIEAEFVFVDGPSWHGRSAPKVQRVLLNVDSLLDAGGRPKLIVIDGRHATTDAIKKRAIPLGYDLLPEFIHAIHKRRWIAALALRGQSVLVRR